MATQFNNESAFALYMEIHDLSYAFLHFCVPLFSDGIRRRFGNSSQEDKSELITSSSPKYVRSFATSEMETKHRPLGAKQAFSSLT